jgi:hypothetical protein
MAIEDQCASPSGDIPVDPVQVREWIITVSTSAALLAVAAGVWCGVSAYRRKLRTEERLVQSNRAEADVRLVQAFTDLVLLAAGTGRYVLSRDLLRALLHSGVLGRNDFDTKDPNSLHTKVVRLALIQGNGGGPTAQKFALFGVVALAARHELLRELGIKALELERVRETLPEKVPELLKELQALRRTLP